MCGFSLIVKMVITGEYSEEELYPYATATFQMSGGSPPPPAPPSPPSHSHHPQPHHPQPHHPQPRSQKAFTALVYQAPSLHDVDSPNMVSVVLCCVVLYPHLSYHQ